MKSIRHRLERALMIAALVPVLLIAIYVYFATQNTLKDSGVRNIEQQVALLTSSVQATLKHVPGDLFYLRDSNSFHHYGRALVINDAATLEKLGRNIARDFLSIAKNRRIYNQLRFIDANGQERIRVEHNESAGTSRILQPEQLRDKKDSPYFIAATKLSLGEFSISEINLNREDGRLEEPAKPTIRYATPVFAVGDRLVGVLILNVDANAFLKPISTTSEPGGLTFALVNDAGFLLSSQRKELNWGGPDDFAHGFNVQDLLPTLPPANTLSEQGSIETGEQLVSYKAIRTAMSDQPIGLLIGFAPKSFILQLLDSFLIVFVLFVALALVIAALIARLTSRTLTAPLINLTEAAEKLSKGELDTPINVTSDDEIGSLAAAFERLRSSIKLLMKLG